MTVTITIDANNATEARAQMAELLGTALIFAEPDQTEVVSTFTPKAVDPVDETIAKTTPTIAEHEAGIAAENAPPKRTRKSKKDEPAPAAETSPAETAPAPQQVAEDPPEVAAQDAADEAAETAASKTDAAPTLDDIRNVLGLYQKVYGLPATTEDGPKVLQEVCGEGVNKVSSVPEDKIADVIAALKKAGNENRFGRTAVAS